MTTTTLLQATTSLLQWGSLDIISEDDFDFDALIDFIMSLPYQFHCQIKEQCSKKQNLYAFSYKIVSAIEQHEQADFKQSIVLTLDNNYNTCYH